MPRAIWSGSISFGLVNVPVKVYTAVSHKEVRFHQLHDKDGVRIQQKRVCPADGEEVPFDHIVKGYPIASDQYVLVTPEELEALDPEATRTIDIEDFVDLAEIDPIFFEKPYYLVPDKGGAKAYGLLLRAMAESGKVAIARVVLRTKQYLVAVRASGDALVMITLNYADEIIPQDEFTALGGETAAPSDRELSMARKLIDALSSEWQPARYRDEYRKRVLAMIEAKAEGERVVQQPSRTEPNLVVDLMAALEQSINKARNDDAPAKGRGSRRADAAGTSNATAGARKKKKSTSRGSSPEADDARSEKPKARQPA